MLGRRDRYDFASEVSRTARLLGSLDARVSIGKDEFEEYQAWEPLSATEASAYRCGQHADTGLLLSWRQRRAIRGLKAHRRIPIAGAPDRSPRIETFPHPNALRVRSSVGDLETLH